MAALREAGRALIGRLSSPFVKLGTAYNNAAKKNPATVGVVTTVLKTSAADAFAQLVVERKSELDLKRNGLFTAFGMTYLGLWQYQLYAKLFPAWTPAITRMVGPAFTAPALVFLDQAVHHPLLYFPCFYTLRGAIEGSSVSSSLTKCYNDMFENLKALWMIWVPAQMVNFSFVPVHLRVPFVAGVSFVWCVVLSGLRGTMDAPVTITADIHPAKAAEHSRARAHLDVSTLAGGTAAATA